MDISWNAATILGDMKVGETRVFVNCQSSATHDYWLVRYTVQDANGQNQPTVSAGHAGTWEEVRPEIEKEALETARVHGA